MLRARRVRAAIAVWIGFLLAQMQAVSAQEPPAEQEESGYFEEIAVDIVNVEVYVTDKEGQPVAGLTIEDFEIYEDGRPVELVNFFTVTDGRPGTVAEQEQEAQQNGQVGEVHGRRPDLQDGVTEFQGLDKTGHACT